MNNTKNIIQKRSPYSIRLSLAILCVLVLLVGLFPAPLFQPTGSAAAETITQTTDADFDGGQFENVELVDTGEAARLQLTTKSTIGEWKMDDRLIPTPRFAQAMAYDTSRQRSIMFGGSNFGYTNNETWYYWASNDTWRRVNCPDKRPSARFGHAMVYDQKNDSVLLFGGYDAQGRRNDTWAFNCTSENWEEITPKDGVKPAARVYHAMIYNTLNETTLLFGGDDGDPLNDTWEFNYTEKEWSKLVVNNAPAPRWLHSMAWDVHNNLSILFGGSDWGTSTYHGDTWAFNRTNKTWVNRAPSSAPTHRDGHAMAYDVHNRSLILYGGYGAEEGQKLNDTYEYNYTANKWTEQSPTNWPLKRNKHSMVYDEKTRRIVLFGGAASFHTGTSHASEEVWLYDTHNTTWEQRSLIPTPREDHAMVFIPTNDRVLLFGGKHWDGSKMRYHDDSWMYDIKNTTWTRLDTPTAPTARAGHVMAYDHARDRVVLFGGNAQSYFNDTWIFNPTTKKWTLATPAEHPAARMYPSMAYHELANVMVLHGGYGANAHFFDDTWVYDMGINTWNNVTGFINLSGRYAHDMVYDRGSGRMIIFGGFVKSGATGAYANDTWSYDLVDNSWRQLTPSTRPPVRGYHQMVYDRSNDLIVLFGGFCGTDYNDMWVYEPTSNRWVQIEQPLRPSPRFGHQMVYSRKSDSIILFGGRDRYSNAMDDTWNFTVEKYSAEGWYTSNTFPVNAYQWQWIVWEAATDARCRVKFQIAVSENGTHWEYIGPDGTPGTFYEEKNSPEIPPHHYGQFMRYRIVFKSEFIGNIPVVHSVSITYLTPAEAPSQPSVRLTSPNGGENWMNETSYPITWEVEGDYPPMEVILAYSLDNGGNWTNITVDENEDAIPIMSDGYYNWTTPNEEASGALIRITLLDKLGQRDVDTSDSTFSIDPPPSRVGNGPGSEADSDHDRVASDDATDDTTTQPDAASDVNNDNDNDNDNDKDKDDANVNVAADAPEESAALASGWSGVVIIVLAAAVVALLLLLSWIVRSDAHRGSHEETDEALDDQVVSAPAIARSRPTKAALLQRAENDGKNGRSH